MFKAKVVVKLREDVLDVQGKAIEEALQASYKEVKDVRVGKVITFNINTKSDLKALKISQQITEELLVNPLIEDYTLDVWDEKKMREELGEDYDL
ncbi:MAG: phosphoribosylformylglycinamidine synthase, purS protein [Candidatus Dadabacteria bacterium]|nr:MAG: phosphoribosylformylglycinamidine synthase, purS protein [Candidatus Dadabacteria bacterium]